MTALVAAVCGAPDAGASALRPIDFHAWTGQGALGAGRSTWVSPLYAPPFPATQLVASWNARTPPGTWIRIEMRGRTRSRWHRRWFVLGRWASGDGDIRRASAPGQVTPDGRVAVDTFIAARGRPLTAYRLRVTALRRPGSTVAPTLSMAGAMTSALPATRTVPASPRPRGAVATALTVPRYSQAIHAGEYPQYDGGGEAWCSPASTQMVVDYWGHSPTHEQLAWVDPHYADPQVDHAARMTYDYAYRGAGNWPFNTAYAAGYGLRAHVTRLASLTELERLIIRRIPVVTSVAFRRGELPGAPYATDGHLMVVVGFTRSGDVIANDPAAPSDAAVRRVYPRRRFETVWLRTRRLRANGTVAAATGGIVYLIRPREVALPTPAQPSYRGSNGS